MIALTAAASQTIESMEDFSKFGEDVQTPYRVSSGSDIIEESPQSKREREEIRENLFVDCPPEIIFNILEVAVISNYFSGDTDSCSLKLVCKGWRDIIEQNPMKKFYPMYQKKLKKFHRKLLRIILKTLT